jgi:hypothetical protein
MRAILRVGLGVGATGFLALCALALAAALVVLPGLLVAGVIAGLAMAKWLPWGWYGRQPAAGLRAGAIAAALAAAGALIALLGFAPRDTAALAARSHLLTFDLSPAVARFAVLGWLGLDVLGVLFCGLAAVCLAVAVTQLFAWSKSARAVRIVNQARALAQVLQRGETWEPVTSSLPALVERGTLSGMLGEVGAALLPPAYRTGAPAHAAYGASDLPAAFASFAPSTPAPALSTGPQTPPRGTSGIWPPPNVTPAFGISLTPHGGVPIPPAAPPIPQPIRPSARPRAPQPQRDHVAFQPTVPMPSAAEPQPPAPAVRVVRKRSSKRPADKELTEAMREALTAWAKQNDGAEDEERAHVAPEERDSADEQAPAPAKVPAKRAPVSSEYLNSSSPAPKRNRKKQNTRDWLC